MDDIDLTPEERATLDNMTDSEQHEILVRTIRQMAPGAYLKAMREAREKLGWGVHMTPHFENWKECWVTEGQSQFDCRPNRVRRFTEEGAKKHAAAFNADVRMGGSRPVWHVEARPLPDASALPPGQVMEWEPRADDPDDAV